MHDDLSFKTHCSIAIAQKVQADLKALGSKMAAYTSLDAEETQILLDLNKGLEYLEHALLRERQAFNEARREAKKPAEW